MFTFDLARILAIFNNNNLNIGLKKAMHIAQTIMDLHSKRVIQVENAAYDRGYKDGSEKPLTSDESYELSRLRGVETHMKTIAKSYVGDIVDMVGRDRKIQVIKELRNKTGLGLKETKDIVDEYLAMTAPF